MPAHDVTRLRRWARSALALAAGLAVAMTSACDASGPSGSKGGDLTWTFGVFAPKGDAGFDYMAQIKGYYKDQGVKATFKTFQGSVPMTQALISGAIDSAEVSPASVYDAAANGAAVKIIGSTLPGLEQVCYAPKSVTSFGQLRGKTVGASAPGALPQVIAEAMFAAKGLDPHSFKVVNAGGDAQRMKSLYAGKIDLACGSPEYEPKLPKGFHVLGRAPELIPDFPREIVVANERALKSKPDAAVRFMAAQMQGIGYALAHKDEEIKVAAQQTGRPASDPSLTVEFDAIKSGHTASPTMVIPTKKLVWLQNFRLKYGLQKKKVDLDKLSDDSYRTKALARTKSG
ncbi:MAG: ABC transporter substrate-binding protein [Actinoallomurus sp.]